MNTLRERGLFAKDANHGSFVDAHDRGLFQSRRGGSANYCPVRQLAKNSPCPRIAMTASLPLEDNTVSLTLPPKR